jgi:hypothetical protein
MQILASFGGVSEFVNLVEIMATVGLIFSPAAWDGSGLFWPAIFQLTLLCCGEVIQWRLVRGSVLRLRVASFVVTWFSINLGFTLAFWGGEIVGPGVSLGALIPVGVLAVLSPAILVILIARAIRSESTARRSAVKTPE